MPDDDDLYHIDFSNPYERHRQHALFMADMFARRPPQGTIEIHGMTGQHAKRWLDAASKILALYKHSESQALYKPQFSPAQLMEKAQHWFLTQCIRWITQ